MYGSIWLFVAHFGNRVVQRLPVSGLYKSRIVKVLCGDIYIIIFILTSDSRKSIISMDSSIISMGGSIISTVGGTTRFYGGRVWVG